MLSMAASFLLNTWAPEWVSLSGLGNSENYSQVGADGSRLVAGGECVSLRPSLCDALMVKPHSPFGAGVISAAYLCLVS